MPIGKFPFGNKVHQTYKKATPRLTVGYPCLHCPHTHKEHSMYEPRLCLMEPCPCPGMKYDEKRLREFKP